MPRKGQSRIRLSIPYKLVERPPSVAEFIALRSDAGWHLPNQKIARAALKRALYSVVAIADDAVVGCARIVGDGLYLYLQDVIVKSASRRCGIGTALVRRCMDVIASIAPANSGCLVVVMAAPELHRFYSRFGFKPVPENLSFMLIRRT
jgi:ribosomal protein S18 acetylase RimI-like enzyme